MPGANVVAAVNEIRDRLLLWSPQAPDRPHTVLPVAQQTGHHIQDVALVPAETG